MYNKGNHNLLRLLQIELPHQSGSLRTNILPADQQGAQISEKVILRQPSFFCFERGTNVFLSVSCYSIVFL